MNMYLWACGSGLCNRWRSILPAIGRCEVTGHKLHILWQSCRYCQVLIEDLWSHVPATMMTMNQWLRLHVQRVEPTDYDNMADRDFCMKTISIFYFPGARPMHELAKQLVPTAEITDTVEEFAKNFVAPTLSVCVRSNHTTHPITRKCAPVSWFETKATDWLRETPDGRLFLTADTPEVSQRFRTLFGNRCLELPRTDYNPHGRRMPVESTMSIYLMARTKNMLGGTWSSMSDMVQLLNPSVVMETPPLIA